MPIKTRLCIRNMLVALWATVFTIQSPFAAETKIAPAFVGQSDNSPFWDVPPTPKIKATLSQIDPLGNLVHLTNPQQVKWVYLSKSKRSRVGQPAVQYEIELDRKLPPIKATNALDVRVSSGEKSTLVLSTDLQTTSLIFAPKDSNEEQSFILTLEPEYPWAYTDPSCERDGYELETLTNQKGLHLYTGIFCVEEGYTASQIYIFRNPDARMLVPEKLKLNQTGSGWARTLVDSEKIPPDSSIALEYSIHHGDSNKKSNYHLRFAPARKFRKLTFSIGTSITSNNFKRKIAFGSSPMNIEISQLDWTQRVALSFKSGPNAKWDFSLSGYLAWVHLTNSFYSQNSLAIQDSTTKVVTTQTLTTGNMRYAGANLRARYSLPWKLPNWKFYISGGYYGVLFRGANDAYTLSSLQGPQIYPSASRFFRNRASLSFYLKYSPITDGTSILDLSSREVAVGAFYLFPSRTHRQWGVSFDYADLLWNGLHKGVYSSELANTSISTGVVYAF